MMKKMALIWMAVVLGWFITPLKAATWYLQANQTGDWNVLASWYSQPLGGGTHPTAITTSDIFDQNGYSITTPKASSGTVTFGGKELILHGGAGISTKTEPTASIYIQNLYSYGGWIQNSAYTGTLAIGIDNFINVSGNTTVSPAENGRGLALTIGTLKSGGDLTALGAAAGAVGGSISLSVGTATAWGGTLYIANGCQFIFATAMTSGGPLVVEGGNTEVTVNAPISFKGLTLDGTVIAPGVYAAATLGFSGTGTVTVTTPAAPSTSVWSMFGVNLPGGGFASGAFYPTDPNEWTYYQGKKLNLVRMAFLWERLQPTLNGPLNTTALASLDTAIALAQARGMHVILDMHNYDRYAISGTSYVVGSTQVPYAAYQYVWQLLAAHYAANAGVYGYDIMNEPHDDSGTWISTAAQYGVNGVRQSDTTHYVIVEGDSYAGAQSWMSVNANLAVTDPSAKVIYSAHTYWDSNNSGVYSGSYDSNNAYPTIGVDRAAQFVYWLGLKGVNGFVGEFGVPNNVASPDYRWNVALNRFLNYLDDNAVKGTYWAGGESWGTNYVLSCAVGTPPHDAPAMSVLQLFGGGTH